MSIRTSIIMPVKNGELFIEESLKSVLKNTTSRDEIIIVDDGSNDKTVEIIKAFEKKNKNIFFYQAKNLLPSGARNLALEKSKGAYISFIDHDDLWPQERLNHHLNLLEQFSSLDVIHGMVKYFSTIPNQLKKFIFLDSHHSAFFFQLGSFTFRRKVFDKIGFFNSELKFGEDVDLYLKMLDKKINIYKDQNIALLYRIHHTNMTHNIEENNSQNLVKIIASSIKRKRGDYPV